MSLAPRDARLPSQRPLGRLHGGGLRVGGQLSWRTSSDPFGMRLCAGPGPRVRRWRCWGPSWTSGASAPLWLRRRSERPAWGSDAFTFSWRGPCIVRSGPPAGSSALSTGFWDGRRGVGGFLRVARSGACWQRLRPTDRPFMLFVPYVGASEVRLVLGLRGIVRGVRGVVPPARSQVFVGPGARPAWRPLGWPSVWTAWGPGCGWVQEYRWLWPSWAVVVVHWGWRSGPPCCAGQGLGLGP